MDENPFNAGSPGAEEVDLYGKFRKTLEFWNLPSSKWWWRQWWWLISTAWLTRLPELLEIEKSATPEQIKKAYRKVCDHISE